MNTVIKLHFAPMKITLLSFLTASALVFAGQAAETTVKISKVHLCCKSCVTAVEKAVGKVEGERSPGAGDVVHRDRGLLPDSPDRANGGEHQRDAASDEEEVSHPERARVGGCVVAHRDALGGYGGHGQSRVVKTVRCLTHGRTPADFRADLAHRRATEQPLPLCEPASMRRAW